MLGWYAEGHAAHFADTVFGHAVASYTDLLARNREYRSWLRDHPAFGAQETAGDESAGGGSYGSGRPADAPYAPGM